MKFQSSVLCQVVSNASRSLNEVKTWETKELWIDVATSLSDPTLVRLNVMETVGHNVRQSVDKKKDPRNRIYLSSNMSLNDSEYRSQVIVPNSPGLLLLLALESGPRGGKSPKTVSS